MIEGGGTKKRGRRKEEMKKKRSAHREALPSIPSEGTEEKK